MSAASNRKRPASRSESASANSSPPAVSGAVSVAPDQEIPTSVALSTSPTGQASVRSSRDGRQEGERKRPAHGQASSPQPYVHSDHVSYFEHVENGQSVVGGDVDPKTPDLTRATTGVGDAQSPTLVSFKDAIASPSSNNAKSSPRYAQSSSSFVLPGAPQSARHQGASPALTSPVQQKVTPVPTETTQRTSSSTSTQTPTPAPLTSYNSHGHGRGSVSGSGSGSGSGGSGARSSGSGGDPLSNPALQNARLSSSTTASKTPSRFVNYADTISNKNYTTANVNTMDLDESLRALYFAPVPLVVLDATRTIKMLNRPAESILGVSDANGVGQRLEKFIAASAKQAYNLALNDAALHATRSTHVMPATTTVTIQPGDQQKSMLNVDVTVSAWYPLDPLFVGSVNSVEARSAIATGTPNETSPQSYQSPASPMDQAKPHSQPIHEAYFTVFLVPTTSARSVSPTSSTRSALLSALRSAAVDYLDMPLIVMSKDTKVVVQNDACRELLKEFRGLAGLDEHSHAPKKRQDSMDVEGDEGEEGLNFDWVTDEMTCWDEKFEKPFEQSDWPIYRSCVMGQVVPTVTMGCESKSNGERILLELSAKPLRSRGGFGEHIGGMLNLRNVTADTLKMRQQVRQEGDIYFRQTCDAMPQLVWVASPSGYIEWYSTSWYEYTGQTEAESRGVGWQAVIHEEDFGEAGNRWSYSLRTGELYETAYRLLRHDGSYRWFLGRALPMRDENGKTQRWFGTCTDIHDQVEALAASRRAQAQLENVINHAAMTIWATDREGRITIAEGPGVRQLKLLAPGTPATSERGQHHHQHDAGGSELDEIMDRGSTSNSNSGQSDPRQQMIGRSIYSIWDPALIGQSMQRALNGETVVEEMEIEGRWFRTSYTPMRATQNDPNTLIDGASCETAGDGEIIGVVGASLDITDRKRAQERVEESLMEKTRALAAEGAAREASRLKSEFLANMSHEIRTPIAGVIGLSELLLDEKGLTAQQRDYAETIQRSAEGLLTVINDVLDFSKVEIGKLDVEKAPFNLEILLRDAKRMLSFATQKKGLDFRESVSLSYKGQLLGDVGRLRQVITNLLTNAIKFTARGHISLEVMELSETSDSLEVKFDVRDTGCGISEATLTRLFKPFSQADPSTARRFGGTGLGLSISKNLVELMKGTIGLASVEGEGSHAWFVVPFSKASSKQAINHGEAASTSGAVEQNPPASMVFPTGGASEEEKQQMRPRQDIWILIAEDNVVNAQIASKNIKRMGFNCRTAENGLKALEELSRNRYDAILMDCQMPECDGYEATRQIRRSLNAEIRMLPIIALTASAIKGDRERALDAGMVDYLAKPVKRPALEATLCKWLFDASARQSLTQYILPFGEPRSAALTDVSVDPMSNGALPRSAGSSASVEAKAFPFPDSASRFKMAAFGGEAMSPNTTQRLAEVRLSPTSEAVIERLKTPDEKLGAEALNFFRSGDALGAAAVLLSARRSSAEELERLREEARIRRPSSASRRMSLTSATDVVDVDLPRTPLHTLPTPAMLARMPSYVRSMREQAGMGRDLDAEMMRATDPDPPALNEAMSSNETVASVDANNGSIVIPNNDIRGGNAGRMLP